MQLYAYGPGFRSQLAKKTLTRFPFRANANKSDQKREKVTVLVRKG